MATESNSDHNNTINEKLFTSQFRKWHEGFYPAYGLAIVMYHDASMESYLKIFRVCLKTLHFYTWI